MARKLTNAQRKQAVALIVEMLTRGMTDAEMWRYFEKRPDKWPITKRTYYTYRKKAEAAFKEVSQYTAEVELGKAISRLNNLYSRAISKKDLKTALSVQREINELLKLKEPDRMPPNITVINSIPMADPTSE